MEEFPSLEEFSGSPAGGPKRLRLQLSLPYKAEAGQLRGRGYGRSAHSWLVELLGPATKCSQRSRSRRRSRSRSLSGGARRAGHGQVR